MKLFYRKFGQGPKLIILHGLFGQSDNWNTHAKQFADHGFEVYTVDLRNHGLSEHSSLWDYQTMSEDIMELIKLCNLQNIILLGHSMGGKVAMQFALDHHKLLDKLIVVDIAPKYYPRSNNNILQALNAVDFKIIKNRKEAESTLSMYISEPEIKQFLLKNIYWNENAELAWRFNLKVITEKIENIGQEISKIKKCNKPAVFIRGELSNYILNEDFNLIQEIFPLSIIETVPNAGHWVHAEQPKYFFDCIIKHISPQKN